MSPEIESAIIAGVVSLISLGGTVVVAAIGFRTTRSVTGSTLAEQHLRTLNERFATAAEKLGNDKPPTVRLAGCMQWRGWLMTGKITVRPASTCCAVTCEWHTSRSLDPGKRRGWVFWPTARSVTRSYA